MHSKIDYCFRLMHKFKAYTDRQGHTKAIVMQGNKSSVVRQEVVINFNKTRWHAHTHAHARTHTYTHTHTHTHIELDSP